MTGAFSAHIPYLRCKRAGRFQCALAASAIAHLLLAVSVVAEPVHDGVRPQDRAPIKAALKLLPPVSAIIAAEDGEKLFMPRVPKRDSVRDGRHGAVSEALQPRVPDAMRFALPQAPDETVYAAADLDSYPRPLVALEFERVTGLSGRLRLELVIDEQGSVNRVKFAEPVAPGVPESDLRALISGARFVPARKDGRAVKSRILLSVEVAAR